jgi:very-short-patch-repair endonuclease
MHNQENPTQYTDATESEVTDAFLLEIEADPTLGYASIQNSVPVVRALRVTNGFKSSVENVEISITCNPRFAQGTKLRFAKLGPDEIRRISPLDLAADHGYLADLQEAVTASITVVAQVADVELSRVVHPIEVLAYDQWAGTHAMPELLASFSMPNNPAIDILIGKASKLLREQYSDLSMNGYQSKSRDVVWKQVSAIYSTLAAENLQYAEPPASFGVDGQKIRTPDRILEGRIATCLDLAMLFSSCMEQAGLRPVVLMKDGHAWIGVWLHQACFPDPLTDDIQAVRKRVDSGEFLAFETTAIAQHASRRPSLRIALEQGAAHLLEEGTFRYAIDIHRARELQIRPLPSRVVSVSQSSVDEVESPVSIEPTPDLPPLDPEFLTPLDFGADETPEGRLSKWKSRLLDLTLRNRLLNFKTTKSTLALIAPDLGRLEDAIAEGIEFRVRSMPNLMEGADPRMAEVHTGRSGRAPLDDMALDALDNKELIARIPQEGLDGNLLTIFSGARTGLEEGGANTLYLALGILRWTETESAESVHQAPIILVPVSLQRQSVRSGFRLSRHDDETIINPTLLQMLRTSFELRIPGLDVLPMDEKGVDVGRVLQAFRLAVREIPKWEVVEQAHLGIFSFTKYLMWKDLQDRTEQLKANRVVRHLIDNPGLAFEKEEFDERFERLDETHQPQDLFTPMLADSSQLKAICVVDAGRDLVLEGPPGTGKSQTITNLIAHLLAKGKTVLFVSEKMAALEVVHRRLDAVGLGPFCLELHSSKARKSEVLQQLGKALDFNGQRTNSDWNREAERLGELREDLNGLVDALHHVHPNGLTVYQAIGTCIEHSGWDAAPMPWSDPLTHDFDALERLRETARRMATLSGSLVALHGHPLEHVGRTEWSPTWQDELLAAARSFEQAVEAFKGSVSAVQTSLNITAAGLSLEGYGKIDFLADVLLGAPQVPLGIAAHAHDVNVRTQLLVLARHGKARNEYWNKLEAGWTEQLSELGAKSINEEWAQASNTWWPKSVLGKRAIRSRLASYRSDGKRPADAAVMAMLPHLTSVNAEDEQLQALKSDAQRLLQDTFNDLQTDWDQVLRHEQWAQRFADAVTLIANDPASAAELRARFRRLVIDDRVLLLPGAALSKSLLAYRDTWRELRAALSALEALADPTTPLQGPVDADGALERMLVVTAAWHRSRSQFMSWCLWRHVREQAIHRGLQGEVSALEDGRVPLDRVEQHFEFSYQNWWVKKVIDKDLTLRTFSSADHERKIREFRRADERFQVLTADYVAAMLAGKVPAATGMVVSSDSELGLLRRELQKKTRHTPVRQLMQGLPSLLARLKPCLLMSPLSVAQYLDAGHAQFDVVIFDEASQIPVWDAVGAIARGKQLVVVGDTKQLPPTSFFSKSTDTDDGVGDDAQIEDLESILDECLGAGMNRQRLQWHYRSRHESLITFSNVTYYDSQLITFPSPVTDDVAVRLERVAGVYDRGGSRTNRAEAEAVVLGIEQHYLDADLQQLTLGVVTFNQSQQALIESLLDARRRQSAQLDKAISAQSREPLFIKNLENVQGDERDIIFFSITYGPDAAGKVTMNFGPLNSEGGQRRLNVAISRARERVVIFSTLKPEQIDLSRVRAAGVRDLKHYLEFALKGPRALLEQSLPTGMEPDSQFESQVIKVLRDHNWVVHPQVGCSGYRIDMGVVDPRAPGRYLIGIECDGRAYHSGATARDRDRLRQAVLEGLGWHLHRIWSTDWWLNPQVEVQKLLARLNAELDADGVNTSSVDVPDPQAVQPEVEAEFHAETETAVENVAFEKAALRQYRSVSPAGGKPEDFYDLAHAHQLTQQLIEIVEGEGPIHENVLHRRISRAWGLERTGTRIVERLRILTPRELGRTTDGDAVFYWPANLNPLEWKVFRAASDEDASRRKVDDVCVEELANGVLHVLGEVGSAPSTDVSRSVCRLIGMARTPADAEARVGLAISGLVEQGSIATSGGLLRLR